MIPLVGSITAKKLIAFCGGAEAVFRQSKVSLQKIHGIGEALANAVGNQKVLELAAREFEFIEKNSIRPVCYTDPDYPTRLKNCEDSPLVFFKKGATDLNHPKILSIVGTRNATAYGIECCEQLVGELASGGHNPVIVSGLAYGIDVCAHKAALQCGLQTVAVMATPLNAVYPAQHKSIAAQIAAEGALITDFTTQDKLDRKNFLKRNRIVAGLADATIVIESAEKGGALVTADIALSYSRDVLAFSGRATDSFSKGCNELIKKNKAALIENAADVEYALGWDKVNAQPTAFQPPLFDSLSEEEQRVVDSLRVVSSDTIDNICRNTGLSVARLSAILLTLEFSGYVKSLPGKSYSLKNKRG